MRKTILWVSAFLCAIAAAAQNTTITASNIAKFGGAKITGSFCLSPTDNAGNGINLTTVSGVQFSPTTPLCFPIVAGVLAAGAIVPDTTKTQPANACYRLTVLDTFKNAVGIYPCIQPSGSSWSFDAYVPSALPSTTAVTLPQFQTNGIANPNQQVYNLVGAGACTTSTASNGTETVTCTGGGSSSPSGAYAFSPILLRPGKILLLFPNQPIVLE